MFVEDMVHLGKVRSEIREIFEYGNKRKQRDLCLQGGGVFRADNMYLISVLVIQVFLLRKV